MRTLVMFNRITVDGSFASADGKLDWVIPEPEVDKEGAAGTGGTDTILFGRRTYDMFESFWPNVRTDGEGADPHNPGRTSPEMAAFAKVINNARKIVFSKSRDTVTWQNSELRREFDPEEIHALKQGPGQGMIIFGSGTIVSQLSAHKLIDAYEFVVSPLLLGNGKHLFAALTQNVPLELRGVKSYPGGSVRLSYSPVHSLQ
jgi:dihydrofolate reductase